MICKEQIKFKVGLEKSLLKIFSECRMLFMDRYSGALN